MTSFGFRSKVAGAKFISFGFTSGLKKNIFIDFGILSPFKNGAYSSLALRSEYLNRNGDFSLSFRYEEFALGDLGFSVIYNTSIASADFSLTSKYKKNIFTSFPFVVSMESARVVDFDIESSYAKTVYKNMRIKSLFILKKYKSYYTKSSFKDTPHIAEVSYGFASYFTKIDRTMPPINKSIDGFTSTVPINISIESVSLSGLTALVGNLDLVIEYNLGEILNSMGIMEITGTINTSSLLQSTGTISFLQERIFMGIYSGDVNLSFVYEPLEDLYSDIIEAAIERDVIDHISQSPESVVMDIHVKNLDIKYKNAEISIPFNNILNLFDDSPYINLISVPYVGTDVNSSIVITGFSTNFYVGAHTSIFKLSPLFVIGATFELITTDSDLLVMDFKMTEISLPVASSKSVLVLDSIRTSYITLPKVIKGYDTWYKYKADMGMGEVVYDVKESVSIDILTEYPEGNTGTLTYVSDYRQVAAVFCGEVCLPSGIEVFRNSIVENIILGASVDNGRVQLFPNYEKSIDLPASTYSFAEFEYSRIIDLTEDLSVEISASVKSLSDGDLLDSYFLFNPLLFIGKNTDDIKYDGTFKYTGRVDLLDILTKDSRLTANLMYNGEPLISGANYISVITYDN